MVPSATAWRWFLRSLFFRQADRRFTIARRRYFRPQENFVRGPRVNDQIRISPVRLVDENDNMVGVVETGEAKRMAQDAGLDLVEVSANSTPPVVRIMDFGKWKYEQSKKDKASRAKSKGSELKEVRLGRSMKIDPHDIEIRLNQARKFLCDGHKVQIVQQFHGREMIHRERGYQRMRDIAETLSDVAKLETSPRMAGRRLSAIFAPDKPKIEKIKRREAAEKGEAQPDQAPTAETETPESLAPPAVETPADETTTVDAPAVETPAAETTPVDAPAVETPAAETTPVDAPAVETPPVEAPTEPVVAPDTAAETPSERAPQPQPAVES